MSGTRRPGRGRLVDRPHKERTHADLSADSRAPAHQAHSDVQRIRPNRGEARAANCWRYDVASGSPATGRISTSRHITLDNVEQSFLALWDSTVAGLQMIREIH